MIAYNIAELHAANSLTKQTALTEKGDVVNGRGDTPNKHDILTGSKADGTAFIGSDDTTCGNWTKSGEGSAFPASDRQDNATDYTAVSWNSSHASRGCSDEGLRSTGGAGLLYCFAAKQRSRPPDRAVPDVCARPSPARPARPTPAPPPPRCRSRAPR